MAERGVEKMPLVAKAIKVATSLMMSWRPAFRMGVKAALLSTWPSARSASVFVAALGVEGHIADATLALCWRTWLKMMTGAEVAANDNIPEALGSASASVAFGQLSGWSLR